MFKDTGFLNRLAPRPSAVSIVYFISTKAAPFPVKIGRTSNELASNRLCQLQVGCPYKLEFFAAVDAPAEYEAELHERFARSYLRGEWYSRSRGLMRFIDEVQKTNPAWRTLVRAPRPGKLTANPQPGEDQCA